MASKNEFRDLLKQKFGVNKNISEPLNPAECERLLDILEHESSAAKLVQSYAEKNSNLGRNNALYGRMRSQAERKLKTLKTDYQQLEQSIKLIENENVGLAARKQQLAEEQRKLEAEVQSLTAQNQSLASNMQGLISKNDELITANTQLKKENKDLKNIVDQIRLRLARDTKELLQYEDSEIRKAIIRLFRWTLG